VTAAPASIDELCTRLRTGEVTAVALPVGIQLIGRLGEDERLLDVAEWAEAALAEAS